MKRFINQIVEKYTFNPVPAGAVDAQEWGKKVMGDSADALGNQDLAFEIKGRPDLHAMKFPAAKDKDFKGTMVYAHPNAGNIGGHLDMVKSLREQGYNVVTFDYSGFGNSQGKASTAQAVGDCQAVIAEVATLAERNKEPFHIVGQSAGGAIAAEAVKDLYDPTFNTAFKKPESLTVVSTFSSLQEATRDVLKSYNFCLNSSLILLLVMSISIRWIP